jgi:hypothetical protein
MFVGQTSKTSRIKAATLFLLSATVLTITGCGAANNATTTATSLSIKGSVHGGQQPISLSTINLYSVDGSNGAVSELTLPVLTDLNGQFDITADYTCPSLTAPMLITATGGNPGLTLGTNNSAISLAAYIGTCGTLSAGTYITINEVTTAAYAAEYNAIQSAGTNGLIKTAFSRAAILSNFATGTSPGSGQGSTSEGGRVPANNINTLADIVATCINSDGAISSATPCGKLFADTGSPTDTLSALINLEGSPSTYSPGSIFSLAPSNGPFQPVSLAAPPTWILTTEQPTAASQLTASPAAGKVGDTVVITSNDPAVTSSVCPFVPPLTISFGTAQAAGSFNQSEITVTVPSGAANGGTLTTSDGSCTFPFTVQDVAAYSIDMSTLAFGNQAAGTQSDAQTVTFTNHNGAAATTVIVGGFTTNATPAASFKIVSDSCTGTTLPYNANCTVSVIFAPAASGAATGTITFYVDAVPVTATVALSGTGT